MSDWIDQLRESLAEDARHKNKIAEKQQREESSLRCMIRIIYDELEKSIKPLVHTLNNRLYAGMGELQFKYSNYTITGDHFLVCLRSFRVYVKADFQAFRIDCRLEQILSKNSNWSPVNGGVEDIVITTDGNQAWLTQNMKREAINLDQIPQVVLSTIVRAAGTLSPSK